MHNCGCNENCIELSVPSQSDMMLVIRLTTSGVVARAGLTLDAVDDVKMAIEEACHFLIKRSHCGVVKLRYARTDGELTVYVQAMGKGCGQEIKADPDEAQVIRCILESMMDQVEFKLDDEDDYAIQMTKRLVTAREHG